jgi:hypothetical protein
MFHASIINAAEKLNAEVNAYKNIPVVSNVTPEQVMENFHQTKVECHFEGSPKIKNRES